MNILVTHPPADLALYYGDTALAGLREHGTVRLNPSSGPLDTAGLVRAAEGCEVIVADRQTSVEREAFETLPHLVAVLRCAMDISIIDVGAANRAGVLVTRASAGFIDSVAELAVGYKVDLARGISDCVAAIRVVGALPHLECYRTLTGCLT